MPCFVYRPDSIDCSRSPRFLLHSMPRAANGGGAWRLEMRSCIPCLYCGFDYPPCPRQRDVTDAVSTTHTSLPMRTGKLYCKSRARRTASNECSAVRVVTFGPNWQRSPIGPLVKAPLPSLRQARLERSRGGHSSISCHPKQLTSLVPLGCTRSRSSRS